MHLAHYSSHGYAPLTSHIIAQIDLTSGFGFGFGCSETTHQTLTDHKLIWPAVSETLVLNETKPTKRSQITDQNVRKEANAKCAVSLHAKRFRILKPIQKSSKCVWVFRNTGANAFAKNQARLAYEDKRDLYCINILKEDIHSGDHSRTVQITFIFIGQTHLVFGKRVCTCVTKHSNAFRTYLNWLKNSKRIWHQPKLHILRLPIFANFDLWSVSVGWV